MNKSREYMITECSHTTSIAHQILTNNKEGPPTLQTTSQLLDDTERERERERERDSRREREEIERDKTEIH